MVERALLAGFHFKRDDRAESDSLLEELEELVATLGIPVKDRMLVTCSKPHSRLLATGGKADEIAERAREIDADVIVIDNDLAPSQQRNWESLSGVCVIDREEVILDIFAQRAITKEASLQVELAQMEYSLPRLTRAWTHLNRQSGSGGTGLRGEGETQLEVDRRIVRRRIDRLRTDLAAVRKRRATQRKERTKVPLSHAAIVGYTNAGKSSMLRSLTGADVLVEDKLFATLDTTTRKVRLPDGQSLLLTDTVGFVRRLPHGLVEAFKATLEEAVLADFRVHVIDASQSHAMEFYDTTMQVLEELGADREKMITVINKIDLVEDRGLLAAFHRRFPEAVYVSAKTGEGLDTLRHKFSDMLRLEVAQHEYAFPLSRSDLVSTLYDIGKVLDTKYEDTEVRLHAIVPNRLRDRFRAFEVNA